MDNPTTNTNSVANPQPAGGDNSTPKNTPTNPQGTPANQPANTGAEKTFTQEQVNNIINDRLARERKSWQSQQTEGQKLAGMTEQERLDYFRNHADEDFKKREANITKRELQMTAKETLIEKGLPVELYTMLNYENAESCNESIKALEKAYKKAVSDGIEQKIKSAAYTPKTGTQEPDGEDGVIKAFYAKNPHLRK